MNGISYTLPGKSGRKDMEERSKNVTVVEVMRDNR